MGELKAFVDGLKAEREKVLGIIDMKIEVATKHRNMKLKESKSFAKQRDLALANKIQTLKEIKQTILCKETN